MNSMVRGAASWGLALAVAGTLPSPALAQELIDGSSLDAILEVTRVHGAATLTVQPSGDPKIEAHLGGLTYFIYFKSCTGNVDCEDIQFYVAFANIRPEIGSINQWNEDKRYAKAYLDADGDAALEMDLNLYGGVSQANFEETVLIWTLLAAQYAEYVGYPTS
jgi:hypothetical protein